ncbi:MAG: hypothetical protein IT558_04550 [Alphaproteobacteria bacterium]|nr:hypothetical protein [Alphaproteobacteria bacterium]
MDFILQWIDLAWFALALAVARKDQRAWVAGFFLSSMVMMRMLVELMEGINYPDGILQIVPMSVLGRGLVIYSLAYLGYIGLIHFSPNAHGSILMAASLAFFFAAFFTFAFAMVL